LKKARKVAGPMAPDKDGKVLHKCRGCNRTAHRTWNASEFPKCTHCEEAGKTSTMDPLEIRYKCLKCGHLDWNLAGDTGKSCHKCGYRIFLKPRKEGRHKDLKAE